jgi:hypothetical protein
MGINALGVKTVDNSNDSDILKKQIEELNFTL